MATITTSLATSFTPAVGDFNVQTTGPVSLERRNTSGAAFLPVAGLERGGYIVANPIAGADYRVMQLGQTTPTIQVDQ